MGGPCPKSVTLLDIANMSTEMSMCEKTQIHYFPPTLADGVLYVIQVCTYSNVGVKLSLFF